MTHAQQMLQTNPASAAVDAATLVECIEACYDCAQSCTACADACLGEDDPKSLARCIRLNLDCADVCDTTGRIVSRQTAFEVQMARAVLRACAEACRLCGEECEQHASHHEHCRVCAEACRRCEQAPSAAPQGLSGRYEGSLVCREKVSIAQCSWTLVGAANGLGVVLDGVYHGALRRGT